MKRLLLAGVLVIAGASGFMWTANAETSKCGSGDQLQHDLTVADACGGGGTSGGQVYVDGKDAGLPEQAPDGYVGFGDPGLVGCWSGDYQDDTDGDGAPGPQNVILDPDNPNPSVDPDSACAPPAPEAPEAPAAP